MSIKLRLLLFYFNYLAKKPSFETLKPISYRKANEAEQGKVGHLIDFPAVEMAVVHDKEIKMRDGAMIPIRVYVPHGSTNRPVFVFYHGGGFVTRSIASHDKACRRLAKANNMVVVSVGYRLAPEFKFPIPHQDCYDATVWVAANISEYGSDANQIVVGGDSAGGNLAAVVAILARDLNGPNIIHQVLIYPTTDARMGFPSIDKYAKGYFLTKGMMNWFVDHYKRTDADKLNPLMSPYLTEDLSNLPPAYVCTAEFDPLKDEGKAYANRLKEAGNTVVFKEYKGVIHGFLNLPKITEKQTFALHEGIQNALR